MEQKTFAQKWDEVQSELTTLRQQLEEARKENTQQFYTASQTIADLKAENASLKKEVEELKNENNKLKEDNERFNQEYNNAYGEGYNEGLYDGMYK